MACGIVPEKPLLNSNPRTHSVSSNTYISQLFHVFVPILDILDLSQYGRILLYLKEDTFRLRSCSIIGRLNQGEELEN
jgi:hypothetical protein